LIPLSTPPTFPLYSLLFTLYSLLFTLWAFIPSVPSPSSSFHEGNYYSPSSKGNFYLLIKILLREFPNPFTPPGPLYLPPSTLIPFIKIYEGSGGIRSLGPGGGELQALRVEEGSTINRFIIGVRVKEGVNLKVK
jgi:hypothetical protein